MAYWAETRHPAPCLFFVAPLLIAYEVGVLYVGQERSQALRNGADVWLRTLLESVNPKLGQLTPLLVFGTLFIWAYRRRADPPLDAGQVVTGMAIESVIFALILWVVSKYIHYAFHYAGIQLSAPPGVVAAVTFLGAGIYEEIIFRLVLFRGMAAVLMTVSTPPKLAMSVAAIGAGAVFAAVHHVGPGGDPVNGFVFVFRTLAGVYFAALFIHRGLGIAVGAHVLYDVFVGTHVD